MAQSVALLRGWAGPPPTFLVIDPGKATGVVLHHKHDGLQRAITVRQLDDLPYYLRSALEPGYVSFVVCESFILAGGQMGRNQAGSDMPSSQGIGMCRAICAWLEIPLYLAHKGCKTAGRAALDRHGLAQRDIARNDHERDAIDIAGYVLREIKRS